MIFRLHTRHFSVKLVKGLCMLPGEYESFCSQFDICHRCVQIQSVVFRGSDPFFLLTIVCCPGEKNKALSVHTQNTLLISNCFNIVSCIQCVQRLERRYEMGRSSCIVLYFLPIHLSYQVISFETGKSYF